MSHLHLVAFDADDTLWHNERLYLTAQNRFKTLLARYHSSEWIAERLDQTEMRNLPHFGYGIKSFALSMIETAVELTEGRITGQEIQILIDAAKEMLTAEVQLVERVPETLARLAEKYALMVITKGDLRDQELKIERSGLAQFFSHVEIVSDKKRANYSRVLQQHNLAPEHFAMVGNSLRSDILPVLELGATAIYIPHELTWAHEHADAPTAAPNFYEVKKFDDLPVLFAQLEQK